MCSRFSLTSPLEALRQLFQFHERPNLAARYNIPPTSQILAIRKRGADGYEAFLPVWGLIPPFAKNRQAAPRMINARSETIAEKPSYRRAYQKQRCLIPADGFYEWKAEENGQKQPYYFYADNQQPLAFAGIWEVWQDPNGTDIVSCSILTQPAPTYIKQIHHRAPVILAAAQFSLWTDERDENPLSHLAPGPENLLSHPVSRAVGNVRAEGEDLIKPIKKEPPPQQGSLF